MSTSGMLSTSLPATLLYMCFGLWTASRNLRQLGSLSQQNSSCTRPAKPISLRAPITDSKPEQSDPTLMSGPAGAQGHRRRPK